MILLKSLYKGFFAAMKEENFEARCYNREKGGCVLIKTMQYKKNDGNSCCSYRRTFAIWLDL